MSQRSELDALFGVTKHVVAPTKLAGRKGRKSTLAEYVSRRFKIRWTYKGKRYVARVRPDGKIRFQGKLFTSPSFAATAITHRPMNGWMTWSYERAPGDWVPLDELRKR